MTEDELREEAAMALFERLNSIIRATNEAVAECGRVAEDIGVRTDVLVAMPDIGADVFATLLTASTVVLSASEFGSPEKCKPEVLRRAFECAMTIAQEQVRATMRENFLANSMPDPWSSSSTNDQTRAEIMAELARE